MILPRSFYLDHDVLDISKKLLGKVLVSDLGGQRTAGMIVETEAYRAPEDKASHAYNNRLTTRTKTMFAMGGVSYVYICYGIHHLFNVVTAEEGVAHAVLVRAVEPLEGMDTMLKRRGFDRLRPELTNGPGKFTVAMGIYKDHDGIALYEASGPLFIEDHRKGEDRFEITSGPRVGMTSAEECAHWPWRFRIKDNRWTSKPNVVKYDW